MTGFVTSAIATPILNLAPGPDMMHCNHSACRAFPLPRVVAVIVALG